MMSFEVMGIVWKAFNHSNQFGYFLLFDDTRFYCQPSTILETIFYLPSCITASMNEILKIIETKCKCSMAEILGRIRFILALSEIFNFIFPAVGFSFHYWLILVYLPFVFNSTALKEIFLYQKVFFYI